MQYLIDQGYSKYRCISCGAEFWSKLERSSCGDPPCGNYGFIANPIFPAKTPDQMREYFLKFFEIRGHTRIRSYPVVARWRDDVLLTNASIYNFQPWVTSGLAPPPANPLVISQRCIRLSDLEHVGYSGRHLTGFEMMAHHAFNYPDLEIYWDQQTIKYCHELLLSLGVDPRKIVYKRKFWTGGGNAGPCLEVIVEGLELATLVFMDLRLDPNGEIEYQSQRYSKMKLRVVDTGYGLERFVWGSQATPTIYDCIFPELISDLSSELGLDLDGLSQILAKISTGFSLDQVSAEFNLSREDLQSMLAPIHGIYIIADHTRSLSWMLEDQVIPSNLGEGYLARMLLRRVLRLLEELGISKSLLELILLQGSISQDYIPTLEKILDLEQQRYARTIERGMRLLRRLGLSKRKLSSQDVSMLYQSHGIPLELIRDQASKLGLEMEIPPDLYSRLAQAEESRLKEPKPSELDSLRSQLDGISTRKLCYNNISRFRAEVIKVIGEWVVLDSSYFYPEGGGQPSDRGWVFLNGSRYPVLDVQQVDDAILHRIPGPKLEPGMKLEFQIDWDLRQAHSRSHTATHILLWACRKVLGDHVWQAGARKGERISRLDITHYQKLSQDQISQIELLANQIALQNLPVEIQYLPRSQAESMYGFRLYQGGVPPGEKLRIVKIGQEIQACAGTHVSSTGELGLIKILRTERIQDGVERLEFCVGIASLQEFQSAHRILDQLCSYFRSDQTRILETAQRMLQDWKKSRKQLENLSKILIKRLIPELMSKAKEAGGVRYLIQDLDLELDQIKLICYELANHGILSLLCSRNGEMVVYSPYPKISSGELISKICSKLGLEGGGSSRMGQIMIPVSKIPQTILKIQDMIPDLISD